MLLQVAVEHGKFKADSGMASNGRLDADTLYRIGVGAHSLESDAAIRYYQMVQDAAADGVTWGITDSYRDYDTQVRLKAEKPKLAAQPGTSEHGLGKAVDLASPDMKNGLDYGTPAYNWLKENAQKYGFYTLTSKNEPWHWEYRGGEKMEVPPAVLAKFQALNDGKPLVFVNDGKVVPAVKGSMPSDIGAVTADGKYTIRSGDNLSSIAKANGTTVEALQRLNGISDPNRIRPGQVISTGSSSANAAPVPATMSPALQAARARLTAARQASPSTASSIRDPLGVGPAGLAVTARVPGNYDYTQNVNPTAAEVAAAKSNTPAMDVSSVQARAIAMDEGVGSLMNPRSVSPGAVTQPPVSTNANLNLARSEQGAQRLAAPVQSAAALPPMPRPRPATPTAGTSASTAPAAPVPATPTAATPNLVQLSSGKTAKVGDTAVLNGAVWTVTDNGDGTGKLVKAAPGILGEINKDTVAGGVVREKVGEAIGQGTDAAVAAAKPIVENVGKAAGDMLGQAGNFLGGLFGGATLAPADNGKAGIKLSVPIQPSPPKAGTTLAIPPPATGAALSAPGAGLTAAQRNAMTSLNGTGMTNALPPTPATMPPGLRPGNALPSTPKSTITVKPAAQPATTQQFYQAGGYVYAANPATGGYTRLGRVGSSSSSSSPASTAATTRPAASSSSSSSSSSVPAGYIDLGNGSFQSESGGIYHTRNL